MIDVGHVHHGKSSANFLDADEILGELNFKGDEARYAVIDELSRLINDEGRIAIMDFKPIGWSSAPCRNKMQSG